LESSGYTGQHRSNSGADGAGTVDDGGHRGQRSCVTLNSLELRARDLGAMVWEIRVQGLGWKVKDVGFEDQGEGCII
jgi:hypothetical protein